MLTEKCYFEFCFVAPSNVLEKSIFSFPEFISALALLVIIYKVTDIRYRFRVAIAPLPLFQLTYYLIGIIGFGTLLTDIWLKERWLVPKSFISQSVWQGLLGGFFLLLAMTWIYYAFIKPPIFCKKNYRKFAQELYRIILKGSDAEISVIANELVRSAESLVKRSRENRPKHRKKQDEKEEEEYKPNVGDYAHDVLLLIGNRKLCRHIIISSPVTAIAFFDSMVTNNKYNLPIGQFAKNVSTEAILNKDSILYHEDEGYASGLLGYLKPFSQAVYGNYRLVEELGKNFGSPLDIHYEVVWSWDASQLETYCRVALMTLQNYIVTGNWNHRSSALYRAIENVQHSCRDVYKLNDIDSDYYSSDAFKRLQATVNFAKETINIINRGENLPSTKLRADDHLINWDFYDYIANFMFEIIFSVTSVKAPPDKCWTIHHNTVWDGFFGLIHEEKAWKIIHFKLRRLLYNEILRLEKYPNYKSSKILGFCLNVMGLTIQKKESHYNSIYPLHKVVLEWTRNNYLHLRSIHKKVAESCLIGSLSFDQESNRLVFTYAEGLSLEAPKDYLELFSKDETNNKNAKQ